MDKQQFWPKEGKLKKGLIILAIVIVGSLLITLVEEKTHTNISKRIPMIIAFSCLGVWLYKPKKANSDSPLEK